MAMDMSTAILGAGCFAVAGVGYLLGKLNTLERGLAFGIGILLIMPVKTYSLVGLALLALLVLWQLYRRKKSPLTVIPQ